MTSSSPENNCPIKMHIKLERRLADKENDYSPYIATSDTTKQQSSSSVSKPAESTDPDEKSLYIYDAIWKEVGRLPCNHFLLYKLHLQFL